MHGLLRISAVAAADLDAVARIESPMRLGEEELRAELALPWSRIWVAHEGGHGVVAFAVFWHVTDEVHLLNLATRTDRQRQGVGRALMGAVIGYARENGVRHVLLEVRQSNLAAIELYRSLGFCDTRTRPGYYQDGEDGIEMTLSLDVEPAERLTKSTEPE
jgi:ribosomal-protein-alanine N-acetyltransferase